MAEPFIEDMQEALRDRQQAINQTINDLSLLAQHGDKFLVPENDRLIAAIIAGVDTVLEMPDRALFQGNRRP